MQELFETVIRRGLTDYARRKLVISPQVISFENRDLAGNTFTSFLQNEVEAFRFGINWIQYHFTFGRQYIIEIKNKEGKIMRITFSSYFRRNLNELHKKYTDILDALSDYHFGAILTATFRSIKTRFLLQLAK